MTTEDVYVLMSGRRSFSALVRSVRLSVSAAAARSFRLDAL